MGDILAFKLRPIIRVEQFGALWVVSVRPTPGGVPADRSFGNAVDAATYALELHNTHGWRIRPRSYETGNLRIGPLDGAA